MIKRFSASDVGRSHSTTADHAPLGSKKTDVIHRKCFNQKRFCDSSAQVSTKIPLRRSGRLQQPSRTCSARPKSDQKPTVTLLNPNEYLLDLTDPYGKASKHSALKARLESLPSIDETKTALDDAGWGGDLKNRFLNATSCKGLDLWFSTLDWENATRLKEALEKALKKALEKACNTSVNKGTDTQTNPPAVSSWDFMNWMQALYPDAYLWLCNYASDEPQIQANYVHLKLWIDYHLVACNLVFVDQKVEPYTPKPSPPPMSTPNPHLKEQRVNRSDQRKERSSPYTRNATPAPRLKLDSESESKSSASESTVDERDQLPRECQYEIAECSWIKKVEAHPEKQTSISSEPFYLCDKKDARTAYNNLKKKNVYTFHSKKATTQEIKEARQFELATRLMHGMILNREKNSDLIGVSLEGLF